MHFRISGGKGGLKHGSRPWLDMDIFWNCPFEFIVCDQLREKQGDTVQKNITLKYYPRGLERVKSVGILEILSPKCGDVLASQYKIMNSPFLSSVQLLYSLITQNKT